ncbi:calcineurin-like phosphoesterase C-terminal domain-containing protein [Akkermansiaceae bacterium]|nr:calcineurin-like phosphoesterase C-terminal domain-containing protein [Akkermansiaceae bacterium]
MKPSIFAALFLSSPLGFAATGTVFHDLNANGVRDAGEPGLPGVAVSNQKEIVRTNAEGRWELPHDEDTIFFVIKPQGWTTPLKEDKTPHFYYIHKPAGSPANLRYKGVAPTGPLPASIDFALTKQEEPDKFKAIFFGDPQPSDIEQVDHIAHDVIAELIGTDAKFGVTLGDIMFDKLDLFEASNANLALVGIPWYNVVGNHDLNMDSNTDEDSDETFHRYFGPNYYSFDYGPTHFIVLDDVSWGIKANGKRSYTGGLDADQIAFVKNDLALVPENKLVMLMMHIPLTDVGNRQELYRIIEKRPYTLSISGHTHWHAHHFIDEEDGWKGAKPHHHIINVTVSGSWWKGNKDETGIPHTLMRDGAPNGYSIITFDGNTHTLDFKAARQPADYQLNIHAPSSVKASELEKTFVYVNVFNGSKKSTVKMRIHQHSDWITMTKTLEADPHYVDTRNREIAADPESKRHLSGPINSDHLWKAPLPAKLHPGSHLIEIEATDAYGKVHTGKRIIRVE